MVEGKNDQAERKEETINFLMLSKTTTVDRHKVQCRPAFNLRIFLKKIATFFKAKLRNFQQKKTLSLTPFLRNCVHFIDPLFSLDIQYAMEYGSILCLYGCRCVFIARGCQAVFLLLLCSMSFFSWRYMFSLFSCHCMYVQK